MPSSQRERLDAAPDRVALQFSEPVALAVSEVVVDRHGSGPVATAGLTAESGGRVVHVALPPLEAGVYVVSFHVVSAVDGHETAGEFAFGVGADGGDLPAQAEEAAPLDRTGVAASGLFLLGLTIGIGGLVGPRLPPAAVGGGPRLRGQRWLRAGLTVAVMGRSLQPDAECSTSTRRVRACPRSPSWGLRDSFWSR